MRQTIASPVRLFATSDIALGTFGTAVWIDSHTEDHFGHSDRGQRLAGKYFPLVTEDDEEPVDTTTVAASLYALDENDGWTRVTLDEEEGKIAVGCIDGRILIYDYT
ncbi:hypothetical protein BDQ12DRAFT_681142 [Crucibulum laeve]|uniref:WD40-repeat-containing domain protein n=1 Tax=Crucibulum laeve TaxID=68775 RepID=A0A5C3M2X4_9AGAR|nr:hypothetical protein BDQ12DRAFT_681142 [Crucibulum laeve]